MALGPRALRNVDQVRGNVQRGEVRGYRRGEHLEFMRVGEVEEVGYVQGERQVARKRAAIKRRENLGGRDEG